MTEHCFGGGWTQIKLDVLRNYLQYYLIALKNNNFTKIYIDAFAGTGEFQPKAKEIGRPDNIVGDMFDAPIAPDNQGPLDGSAKIALNAGGFDRYIFIEHHPQRFRDLQYLCGRYSSLNAQAHNGDANDILKQVLKQFDKSHWRGVAFLDPYGLQVDWATLKEIAETQVIDVWYLFPLSGLYRQAARQMVNVDESKAAAIDRCLGTTAWREAFYRADLNTDLFGDDPLLTRHADVDVIESFVRERLETIFPKVLPPLRLPKNGAPLFSLFFAVSNPSGRAIGVATRIAKHILDHA